jgi:tRNA pseudouridine55 synthase
MADCASCPRAQVASGQRWVAPMRAVPLSGILNVDKPLGMTSHDVVDAVRRMAGQRKVGHAGTLDPMASGVLLLCLGQATRVAEYLMAGQKRYRATLALGTTTDTYDAAGRITSSGGRTDFSRTEIEAALVRFIGHIEQVPPMYSALKQGGQPLYRLARQGRTVDRQAREVDIEQIELLDWTPPSLTLDVTCSPGTYVRSLAHDLGQHLASGATLTTLVRLASGRFTIGEAVSLDRLEEAFQHDQQDRYLLPLDEALLDWPAMIVGAEVARQIVQGQAVRGGPSANNGDEIALCRAYSLDGDFLAVMSYHAPSGQWRPRKVFAQA